ncbi:MAG: acylphosphatase [bacterium]|nr:acylphosphatase [bacterium]
MLKEIKCKISGRVQMVLFRDFVQRKARGLLLAGTVENREDGSISVTAQGDEEKLKRLIEHLHKGPFLARVLRVDVVWGEPSQKFQGFNILY